VAREQIRSGAWCGPTSSLAPGFVQANLVVLPSALADAFERFCRANAPALPLIERTAVGDPVPRRTTPTADLRVDLPLYCVYEDGRLVSEPLDLIGRWDDDSVGFLIGCSFTFDSLLTAAGVRLRHRERGGNIPMYVTRRIARPVGLFGGPIVVSMRPVPAADIDRVIHLTAPLRLAHGAPLHVGDPRALGVEDLTRPDYGDPVPVGPGEIPVFWGCGVTAQAVAVAARVPRMITHAPGHMFITDWTLADLARA